MRTQRNFSTQAGWYASLGWSNVSRVGTVEFGALALGAEPVGRGGRSFHQVLICISLVIEWEQHSVSGRAVLPWAAR